MLRKKPKKEKSNSSSIDGFIPNRKGRVIREPFSSTQDVPSLQPANKQILISDFDRNRAGREHSLKNELMNKNPLIKTGVTWNTALQGSDHIDLNKTGRRSLKDKEEPEKKHKHQRHNWKKIVIRTVLTLFILLIGIGGYVGYKFFHNVDKVFGGNVISNIEAFFGDTTLKGEDSGRVNILLAGDSTDQAGHQGAQLTDSIMIVSIDTQNNTAFLLSIPRDLYVYIPGLSSYQKINAANDVSNFSASGYPSGGMGELEQVVQNDLGIPIDYYALISYNAFRDSVNAVDGITIDIQSPDPRGIYDSNTGIKLPNGLVNLDGQEALNLARSRGDGPGSYGFPDSDFDRTEHQRQMLIALTQKAETAGVVSNPIKLGELFDSLGNNVQTDLNLADVVKLSKLAKSADLKNAQSLTYSYGGTDPLLTGETIDGSDVLVPSAGIGNYSGLQGYYQQITQ